MNKINIVLGLGFGDEGKGLVTDNLVLNSEKPFVIRFSGGHQVGHTVRTKQGLHHVFSNFGSGTLRNAPTYWSKHCTVEPVGLVREYKALKAKGVNPELFIDALCPVVTPFDIEMNRKKNDFTGHGSVGVGFGTTIQRQENNFCLFVQDLLFEPVYKAKLENIKEYYKSCGIEENIEEKLIFITAIQEMLQVVDIVNEKDIMWSLKKKDNTIIFEGNQGILLDETFGFFPNVTRSSTTSKNVKSILSSIGSTHVPDIYYITRSYQTRHGNGFMTNEHLPLEIIENPFESNKENKYQGKFRTSALDLDLLDYSLQCDSNFHTIHNKILVMTCVDQINKTFSYTKNHELKSLDKSEIKKVKDMLSFDFKEMYISESPISENLTKI